MIRRGSFDASEAFDDAWEKRGSSTTGHDEMNELVRTAELLCRSAVAQPSEAFRLELRERLMTEAADVLVAQPAERPVRTAARPSRARRRVVAAAAAAIAALGAVGTVASSASAVPGDLLYPVKRGVENVQVALHRDDASRGEYRLQQARERLAEAQYLDQAGDAKRLVSTLEDFTSQASSGTDELFAAYETHQSADDIDTVNDFVAEASVTLASLSSSVPADARGAFESATGIVTQAATQASNLCTTCAAADVSSLVDTVQSLVKTVPVERPSTSKSDKDDHPATTATTAAPQQNNHAASGSGSSGSSGSGGASTPTPTPTPQSLVGGAVDGLLGDDGLVPNLLGGLLGGK